MRRSAEYVSAKPVKLTFEPSNICHLRCPLCPTGLGLLEHSPKNANLQMFSRLLDQIGEYLFFIDFYNWGEPLINPRLEELLAEANKHRISTTVSTNFSLTVSDGRLKKLVESGLNHIIISLDGASPDTVGQYRRGSNFDLVVRNMRRLVAIRDGLGSKTPYITWQYLVFSFNEHELLKAQDMAREIGVDRIEFARAYLDEGDHRIPVEDRLLMRKWIPSDPKLTFYDPGCAGSSLSVPLKRKATSRLPRCDWPYMSSAINSDGSVTACCGLYKKRDDVGTLGEGGGTPFMEIYNNADFRAIRGGLAGRAEIPDRLTCSVCSSSEMMAYAKGVNRWIVLTTIAKLAEYVLKPLGELNWGRHKARKKALRIKWPE